MINSLQKANSKIVNIQNSNLTIYDKAEIGDETFWLTSIELTDVLNDKLIGNKSLQGLPIKTRSKVAKRLVCEALGYAIPKVFNKVQPRFPCQGFDTYVQKSNNLQIWNEELDPERRYVLIGLDSNDIIIKIRVVTGIDLGKLDTTGTLTQKYQARLPKIENTLELISNSDTDILALATENTEINLNRISPVDDPTEKGLLPIKDIFNKLSVLIGKSFFDIGATQERNRGAALHKLVCEVLGYHIYKDNGQFPDVKHQLLEVKLQTSATIDLGLVTPDSESKLDIEKLYDNTVRHCDVRYAIFFANINLGTITLTNLYLTTGRDFFTKFTRFEGKVLNKKLQLRLPKTFFLDELI